MIIQPATFPSNLPSFKTLFLISHFLLPVIVHNTVDS